MSRAEICDDANTDGEKSGDKRTAATLAIDGRSMSHVELDERSIKLALRLRAAGVMPGDHVAILMRNCLNYVVACWAAQRSGLYFTPVNWHLQPDEVAYIIEDCGAKALIISDEEKDVVNRLRPRIAKVELFLTDGPAAEGFASLNDIYASPAGREDLVQTEGCVMFYSSGTTGRPKGIKRPASPAPFGHPALPEIMITRQYEINSDSVILCAAPMYHAAPMTWALAGMRQGARLVIMERFDELEALRLIEEYRVTHCQFVPTMFVRLLRLPDGDRKKFDVSSMKFAVHAGAPCAPEIKRQMLDWFGPVIFEYYGGSEGVCFCAASPQEWLERPGTVGKPVFGKIHILGDAGNELPPGQIGHVFCSGAPPFQYHNDEAKTRAAYNAQGYATMGDYGHIDEDGYLFLADRRTDLILSGGVNIYPREIEEALINHPAVGDVAAVGVPSKEWGQEVLAVVSLREGYAPSEALAGTLIAFCRDRIAHYKCPRRVEFGELPRTPTGKLQRRKVKEQYSGDAALAHS